MGVSSSKTVSSNGGVTSMTGFGRQNTPLFAQDGTQFSMDNVFQILGRIIATAPAQQPLSALFASRTGTREAQNCITFLAREFNTLLSPLYKEQLLDLPGTVVQLLLEREDLQVTDEYRVFLLLAAWVDRQLELKYFDTLSPEQQEKYAKPDRTPKSSPAVVPTPPPPTIDDTAEDSSDQVEEVEVYIPGWKLDDEYILQLKAALMPYLEYIRFPMFSPEALVATEEEGLVPHHFIHEAYQFKYYSDARIVVPNKQSSRVQPRRYLDALTWNTKWHGQHILITEDGTLATKTTAHWYSIAVAKQGWRNGTHAWAIKIDGDEVYAGLAASDFKGTALDNYLGLPNSWACNYHGSLSGTGTPGTGIAFGKNDILGFVLDCVRHNTQHTQYP
eukprot:TRINITY_DN9779_c0_g1_i1.p1 TRINITY_DN9779_c0_g1~~TRINITY_DN9779_c0_g1_i1.p1  ORF type:complete len:389 (-),score=56.25 TRINITY_DN9779_c0_g1_i1:126-1292(-)